MADKEKSKFNPWRAVFPPASGGPNIPINTSIHLRPSSSPLTGNHKTMKNAIASAERETNEVIEFLKTINEENIQNKEISDTIMADAFKAKIKRIKNYLRAKHDDRIEELETLTAKIERLLGAPASEGGRRRSYHRKHKRARKTRRIRTRKN
jgi:iron-sulfur cluster repair protein YtfE (RIC family)